jgi:hypothetical protein
MNDDELRRRFADVKRADKKLTPEFDSMWRADRRVAERKARGRWLFVVPALAAAAMFVVWCGTKSTFPGAPAPQAAAPAATAAPTYVGKVTLDPAPLDFLLDAPAVRATGLDSTSLDGW